MEKGRVISVSPTEGQKVDKGSSVTLVVSSGKPQAQVPDVVGRSFDEASVDPPGGRLQGHAHGQGVRDKDPGTVLSQNPKSGTHDRHGHHHRAHGGQGAQPGRRARRDRRGPAAAIAALSGQGFVIDQQSKDVPTPDGDGVVLEQSPTGRQEGQEGLEGHDRRRQVQPQTSTRRGTTTGTTTRAARRARGRPREGRRPGRRPIVRARGLPRVRRVGARGADRGRLTTSSGSISAATATWSCEGEEVALRAGGGLLDADAVFPGAARPLRRGRQRTGDARGARRPLRRLGRAGQRAVHGQGHLQGRHGPRRACRRSPTGRWTPPRAWPWPIRRR